MTNETAIDPRPHHDRLSGRAEQCWCSLPCNRQNIRYFAAWLMLFLSSFVAAQSTRQIYTGPSGTGIFNLAVNTPVLVGEEAFTVSLYESGSTMQLRRTPYSTVSYLYAGVDEGGTLHLQRRLRWPERGIDDRLELHLQLGTTQTFATGYGGVLAELVFQEGRGGRLLIRVVNDPPLERPQNTGF